MRNFEYANPTRLVFGRGTIARLTELVPAGARVLLLYGGGSILANGVHAQVRAALAGQKAITVGEFGGIEPNPTFETLMQAVERIRREGWDFLLAVGGGSVLDGTKFVAAAVPYAGDPWDLAAERAPVGDALPIGAVLTLPGTGSESNGYAVVSRRATQEKLSFGDERLHPRFAVLDPAVTFSLPPRQVANGIVDAYVHVLEQYLTYPADAPLQDRFAESILQTLIEVGPATLARPEDYDARANFMWCATMALNGLIGLGVPQDWATHAIGHELTALHGIDHARTLAVVLPSLLAHQRKSKRAKLAQYATRVWGVTAGDESARADQAIERTRAFFESLGVATRLSGYGVGADVARAVARRLDARGDTALGERRDVTPAAVEAILAAAL